MEKIKVVIDSKLKYNEMTVEDGGQYKDFCISVGEDNGIFAKLCSWDDEKKHEIFEKFINRNVRITIETLD